MASAETGARGPSQHRLLSHFDANAFSGRIERGYCYVAPMMGGVGLTAFAAAKVTAFDQPLAGASTFALNYGLGTVLRAERCNPDSARLRGVGEQFRHRPFDCGHVPDAARCIVRGERCRAGKRRSACHHRCRSAWLNGFSLATTFEGEFSDATRSHAGKGVFRYAW